MAQHESSHLLTSESRDVPDNVRQQVYERDAGCCRVCGRFVDRPGVHHIEYRSEGGLNVVANLITIGWLPGHDCHLPVVHANKKLWQPILQRVVLLDGVNALQLRRWASERGSEARTDGRPDHRGPTNGRHGRLT